MAALEGAGDNASVDAYLERLTRFYRLVSCPNLVPASRAITPNWSMRGVGCPFLGPRAMAKEPLWRLPFAVCVPPLCGTQLGSLATNLMITNGCAAGTHACALAFSRTSHYEPSKVKDVNKLLSKVCPPTTKTPRCHPSHLSMPISNHPSIHPSEYAFVLGRPSTKDEKSPYSVH